MSEDAPPTSASQEPANAPQTTPTLCGLSPDLQLEGLRPFKSFFIAEVVGDAQIDLRGLLRDIEQELSVGKGGRRRRQLFVDPGADGEGAAAFLHYSDRRQVPWTTESVQDLHHHLVVCLPFGSLVAIAATEGSRRSALLRALRRGALGPLRLIPPARLKAAFVKGKARTLWLKGTHRRSSFKADNKVLSGIDLRDALDPIGDQTYRYTALRSATNVAAIGDVIGLAVDQSRVWTGPAADWNDFVDAVGAVLAEVSVAQVTNVEPLPVVAAAVTDLTDVDGPFDVAITPPELLLAPPPTDPQEVQRLQRLEQLAYGTVFDVGPLSATGFEATVRANGSTLGRIRVDFRESDGQIETDVATTDIEPGRSAAMEEVVRNVRDPEVLTVHFDSGHVIADRQVFVVRHRDQPFEDWAWADFAGYNVGREKPDPVTAIGTQDSLFDWVLAEWPAGAGFAGARGWLACDDRPGETADFVHLDDTGSVPLLSLLHVKGAGNASPGRGISVVAYETVGSQAVKNLRHLEAVLLERGLQAAVEDYLTDLAWENGQPRTRQDMVVRLGNLGSNVRRRVVIVQPHVLQSRLTAIRGGNPPLVADIARNQQLDTLLLGFAGAVRSMGAQFVVVGDSR